MRKLKKIAMILSAALILNSLSACEASGDKDTVTDTNSDQASADTDSSQTSADSEALNNSAMTSISTSAPLGRFATSTQLRAGFDVK